MRERRESEAVCAGGAGMCGLIQHAIGINEESKDGRRRVGDS